MLKSGVKNLSLVVDFQIISHSNSGVQMYVSFVLKVFIATFLITIKNIFNNIVLTIIQSLNKIAEHDLYIRTSLEKN